VSASHYDQPPFDNFPPDTVPAIPYEDEPEHNNSGFCGKMSHECHENKESIAELEQARQLGEVSDEDANRIYRGKTIGGW
jgi:hypothetical protein